MTEKLWIFDLDGVLIDSRDLHFYALNDALSEVDRKYLIRYDEHLAKYDGLPTSKKLQLLTQEKGLSPSDYNKIWKLKQEKTVQRFKEKIKPDPKLIQIFGILRDRGYKLAVASNSIKETLSIALDQLGIRSFVDVIQSNEDVQRPKPYPEMYWNCMIAADALPKDTIIVEDSHIGRQGAIDSGAQLLHVENPHNLTLNKIEAFLDKTSSPNYIPWKDSKLNVLIPMAGKGSRFTDAGYVFPKPLIEVKGKPMIQVVYENLNIEANFIFIVQKEHYEKYNLQYMLNLVAPGCQIVQTDKVTEGAACTTLLAKKLIDNENPLLIVNSDQFIEWNSNEVMYAFSNDQIDGGILTFESSHPKWSYAKVGDSGFVEEVAEKKVISNQATVGAYFWSHGHDYVKYAKRMIKKDIRTNNEFYVAPVFNEAIQDGKKIRVKQVEKMWGIGDPQSLEYFLNNYKGEI